MLNPRPHPAAAPALLPPLPGWVTAPAPQTLEAAAFRSGAALAHLHLVAAASEVPQALWRDRLALAAAEACAGHAGRRESQAALRDAVHLTKAGDDPGPAGAIFAQWSRAVARPISVGHLGRTLERVPPDRIAVCLDAPGGTPVDRAVAVIEAVLTGTPRAGTAALILADAVLTQSLGGGHILPLLSLALKPRDLRLRGDALRLACHRAAVSGAGQAVGQAADLARRAARLKAVVPTLRARGAAAAVDLFLSRDAVLPAALPLPDRAARRLCDRLVGLGAVRELTGRDIFRLYGV